MASMASQITSLTIIYSTVYSGADQSKHQSSASLAYVWGIHRGPVNSPPKWPVTRKIFPFDDVIMSRRHVSKIFIYTTYIPPQSAIWSVNDIIYPSASLLWSSQGVLRWNEIYREPTVPYTCSFCKYWPCLIVWTSNLIYPPHPVPLWKCSILFWMLIIVLDAIYIYPLQILNMVTDDQKVAGNNSTGNSHWLSSYPEWSMS